MRARDSLGAFAGISRFAWFRMDEQYRYEAGAWGACDVVVDSPWFVLVSTAPGDRRACVVRARGWRARQAAGQATPGRLLAAAVPACLLPDARVCHFFFRECAWMYVCMHACMCVCIVCLGGRLSTPSSQTRTPCRLIVNPKRLHPPRKTPICFQVREMIVCTPRRSLHCALLLSSSTFSSSIVLTTRGTCS